MGITWFADCPDCSGLGFNKSDDQSRVTCPRCQGVGRVPKVEKKDANAAAASSTAKSN